MSRADVKPLQLRAPIIVTRFQPFEKRENIEAAHNFEEGCFFEFADFSHVLKDLFVFVLFSPHLPALAKKLNRNAERITLGLFAEKNPVLFFSTKPD